MALSACAMVEASEMTKDRTITKVVKLLEKMQAKSKKDGIEDTELFAKFKCYCDDNTEEKSATIKEITERIPVVNAKIAGLKASTGELSAENSRLEASMAENEAARNEAKALRKKAQADFEQEEADMETAIAALNKAIGILAAVGADQTKSTSASHEKFMGKGESLVSIKTDIAQALAAASAFAGVETVKRVNAFLEAPFSGVYNAQSGEIVGILKNMEDTFKLNLKNARAAEKKSIEDFNALMAIKTEEYETMEGAVKKNNDTMATNDKQLADSELELDTITGTLEDAQKFLEDLTNVCTEKTKLYNERKQIRSQEEAAISQAIAILNNEDTFALFGKVASTSSGRSFIQLSTDKQTRASIQMYLQQASRKTNSMRLARVAEAMAESPFAKVLALIEDMHTLIDKEQKADADEKKWCEDERATTNANIDRLKGEISDLTDAILKNKEDIKDRVKSIEEDTKSLGENRDNQRTSTEQRRKEHVAYVQNARNLNDAISTVKTAVAVLNKFYKWLHSKQGAHHYDEKPKQDFGGANLRRMSGADVDQLKEACSEEPECAGFNTAGWLKGPAIDEAKLYKWDEGSLYVKVFDEKNPVGLLQEPEAVAPPDTFGDTFGGQREEGNEVVGMLEFIIKESNTELDAANTGEHEAQVTYESLLTDLTTEEDNLVQSLSKLNQQKALLEQDLEENSEAKASAEKSLAENERYLEKIKPGCDFMMENFGTRTDNRNAEKKGLKIAAEKLRAVEATASARTN